MMRPTSVEIKSASKDVAWEYATLLGSALEIAKTPGSPINHLVQEAFLVHVRNLAEFFREGVEAFKKAKVPPDRTKDNIYAVDFCLSVGWKPKAFGHDTKLIKAINKTLSHMTYSRARASKTHEHFEGYSHLHGTVKLIRQTWADFSKSIDPQFLHPKNPEDIPYWLNHHTRNWEVNFGDLESQFETRVIVLARENPVWVRSQTPDGLV